MVAFAFIRMDERVARCDLCIKRTAGPSGGRLALHAQAALELDRPGAPLRSVELGRFDYVTADGRTGTFTPELMAHGFALPPALVVSTVNVLL
jgi:hypothetical protein